MVATFRKIDWKSFFFCSLQYWTVIYSKLKEDLIYWKYHKSRRLLQPLKNSCNVGRIYKTVYILLFTDKGNLQFIRSAASVNVQTEGNKLLILPFGLKNNVFRRRQWGRKVSQLPGRFISRWNVLRGVRSTAEGMSQFLLPLAEFTD